ncbi:MAG: 30S ribosomal protein S4 [Patescibacteria group bacterium]
MKKSTHKACRRYGVKLCQSDKCPVIRRNYPPGMHGPKGARKLTEYGRQLAEKQKAKIVYGLREKQFANYFDAAFKKVGNTAELLFKLLESRLDNVVYRFGFAKTRTQARQLVSHGHVEVNGKKVDIPSFQTKIGDAISLREKTLKTNAFANLAEALKDKEVMSWLSLDAKELKGKIVDLPKLGEVEMNIDWRMIVEFYSK